MIFREIELAGALLVDLEPHADERGSFSRSFCEREFAAHGLPVRFPQCNISRNKRRGTLRGMHYEVPFGAKLVRCTAGAVYDVIVDLRPDSATHLRWAGFELTAEAGRALFVPTGVAHGFLTLADDTDVFYHMGDFYQPEGSRGFRWNDPTFGIAWPIPPSVISERDATYPDFDATHVAGL
jgi:dTDP-4-dehydrorhamnose 3,5-epimerase